MKTKKINTGIYSLEWNGQKFEIERWDNGDWYVFEISSSGRRDWWQCYRTKAAAIRSFED